MPWVWAIISVYRLSTGSGTGVAKYELIAKSPDTEVEKDSDLPRFELLSDDPNVGKVFFCQCLSR